ncbi:heparan sulfate glucosamine 3-O-sulfotransferase 1-like [Mya arenaria]|uniref:heparan sulfate glucosamine 3-O-sulfotransferase 1-like n=1 Tax=Mya arenaria TaxID=6604 RepID=UPI0022E44C5A|nr:heparan sulfate glucosamine 3-O-sulfotransferase 1-like [Mya arenaria]
MSQEHLDREMDRIYNAAQDNLDSETDTLASSNVGSDTYEALREKSDFHPIPKLTGKCVKRFPQAIIIGIQKCGTYALLFFLDKHPQIAGCLHPPEPRFFDKDPDADVSYTNYLKGLSKKSVVQSAGVIKWKNSFDKYKEKMPCSFKQQITIEKDPAYFYQEFVANRIQQWAPDIKLIFIVKNPVERAISAIAMYRARSEIDKNKTVDDIVFKQGDHGKMTVNEEAVCNVTKYSDYQYYMRGKGRKHPYVSEGTLNTLKEYFAPKNAKFFKMVNKTFDWE